MTCLEFPMFLSSFRWFLATPFRVSINQPAAEICCSSTGSTLEAEAKTRGWPHLHLVQSEGPSGIVRRNTPDLVSSQPRSSRRCCWCWQYSWKGEKIFSEVFPGNWGSSSHCRFLLTGYVFMTFLRKIPHTRCVRVFCSVWLSETEKRNDPAEGSTSVVTLSSDSAAWIHVTFTWSMLTSIGAVFSLIYGKLKGSVTHRNLLNPHRCDPDSMKESGRKKKKKN